MAPQIQLGLEHLFSRKASLQKGVKDFLAEQAKKAEAAAAAGKRKAQDAPETSNKVQRTAGAPMHPRVYQLQSRPR